MIFSGFFLFFVSIKKIFKAIKHANIMIYTKYFDIEWNEKGKFQNDKKDLVWLQRFEKLRIQEAPWGSHRSGKNKKGISLSGFLKKSKSNFEDFQ